MAVTERHECEICHGVFDLCPHAIAHAQRIMVDA